MDIHGTLHFEPVARGTRMRWRWELEPHGALAMMRPVVGCLGRRQEHAIWANLKRLLEERGTPPPG